MALAERNFVRDLSTTPRDGDVVLGDDWVAPDQSAPDELRVRRERRGLFSLRTSPLTRKIITFNLIALNVLVAGILYLNSSRDSLALQRASSLLSEAELIADVIEARLPEGGVVDLATGGGIDVAATLEGLDLRSGVDVFVFDTAETLIATSEGRLPLAEKLGAEGDDSRTLLTDGLTFVWDAVSGVFSGGQDDAAALPLEDQFKPLIAGSLTSGTHIENTIDANGNTLFTVLTPIMQSGQPLGVVAIASAAGEIDKLVRSERERVLQMFVIATLVSIGLSLVLASTIANPLADLAAAAELGRDKDARKMNPGRIRIPDLTARPDEIGRLSGALRGMVSALYNRIDGNEQFAADVAHEIKNPLASLRSAVGTLRMIKREDQREKLLDVIDHDVRRLDRLVSDISNASRLDSELVKEEEEQFDLLNMVGNLSQYLGEDAKSKGIDFITDLPANPILVHGLEARLAQVFVNLITNAISFCEDGDAIRVWARKRENRVLVVVEDTGPGIPDQALSKIFKRFYSERPVEHFGNNSGLGLAISKQIVEAHGGVIWAENIRPTEADITSEPLGARFVVGLPT
ncbi:sensor histidine kinase [Sulfitobacter mediterraneus]|uniref:sensor histidine kinase n=1 Tax=Sulfitobacter mediterraneus TaxID=83219 RepID=UPI0019322F2B|nr:sensor histidine kinase [Sulfitobacter mediterraneus]MBM1633445.1 sensor histidine kinase [Sulfitobacter mediterraneus]MBM1640421.1 sensor histidine kinase [Sulfitobacter mediterraneus]MBM1645310.1 sensor histidine kinase [Sulfitobacter mediterraneus]MBM1648541.1 sensor histidine kinase [Sulfitobacter mediterraneus]MBM1652561.1 sensor histidine kinase [Sulfitobacter mediterraneus]